MQSKDAIRAIKERLNIVDIVRRYVELKRNGPRWVAPCPFHQETKPSFSVNEDQGLFYCFGCHASGDIFDFYGRINGLDFKECLEQLAAEAGISIERGRGDPGRQGEERQRRSGAAANAAHVRSGLPAISARPSPAPRPPNVAPISNGAA